MAKPKIYWVCILSSCLFMQCVASPLLLSPVRFEDFADTITPLLTELRQAPLSPSAFSLAATRFIVMLPFLPLMMAIPGVTAVIMPMFMAMQDRLKTIIPNFPNLFGNTGGNSGNQLGGVVSNLANIFGNRPGNNANQQGGSIANSVANVVADSSSATPTFFRFKRSLLKLPTKALNEGFREVFDILHKTDDVINHLTSEQPDCRRQVVCRLHHYIDPSIGSFIGNMIQVFRLETQVEKLDISDFTREIIKDVLKSASTGLYHKDCNSVYARCSLSSRKMF